MPAAERSAVTLSDEVYERLRAEIVKGAYRPNERLVEADLADHLEVSRTPIREGLQRLMADGLVVSHRRGWIVREHTLDEISEIYDVRAALEGYAARLAAVRASAPALKQIEALHRAVVDDSKRAPRHRLVEDNDRFHDAVIAAAGNRRLAAAIRQSCEHYFNLRIAKLYSDDEATRSIAGHAAIVRALKKRDADAAEAAARAHVIEALAVLTEKLG